MNFIYFRQPVQKRKFPSINADVPLQPKVTTSFEMLFHFRFVVYNYPLPCAPRIEGACLQGLVMPCPLRISSSCKEEVISKANSKGPFASWRRLVLEALDDRKHVDLAKQESVHMHPNTPKHLKSIPWPTPRDLGVPEDFLLLSTLHRKMQTLPHALFQKQHSQPLHELFVEYLLPSRQGTAYLGGPKGYTADAQKPQKAKPVVMVKSHSKTNIDSDLWGDIVVSPCINY